MSLWILKVASSIENTWSQFFWNAKYFVKSCLPETELFLAIVFYMNDLHNNWIHVIQTVVRLNKKPVEVFHLTFPDFAFEIDK